MIPNTSPTAQSQMSANIPTNLNSSNNEDVQELLPIKDTPLYMHGSKSTGYCIVMKDAQLSGYFETKEALLKYVKTKPWELIITIMTFVCDTYHIIKNQRQNEQQQGENTKAEG